MSKKSTRRYTIDTHPLLWTLTDPDRISPRVKPIFEHMTEGTTTLYIPAIVLTEMMLVAERQWISTTSAELLETIRTIQNASNYILLPLMPETIIASHPLANDIPDMFDRLIIAEALRLRTPLITCDRTIIESGLVDILWE
jgi:PIN domain nuclease of toxin-antitoxin system